MDKHYTEKIIELYEEFPTTFKQFKIETKTKQGKEVLFAFFYLLKDIKLTIYMLNKNAFQIKNNYRKNSKELLIKKVKACDFFETVASKSNHLLFFGNSFDKPSFYIYTKPSIFTKLNTFVKVAKLKNLEPILQCSFCDFVAEYYIVLAHEASIHNAHNLFGIEKIHCINKCIFNKDHKIHQHYSENNPRETLKSLYLCYIQYLQTKPFFDIATQSLHISIEKDCLNIRNLFKIVSKLLSKFKYCTRRETVKLILKQKHIQSGTDVFTDIRYIKRKKGVDKLQIEETYQRALLKTFNKKSLTTVVLKFYEPEPEIKLDDEIEHLENNHCQHSVDNNCDNCFKVENPIKSEIMDHNEIDLTEFIQPTNTQSQQPEIQCQQQTHHQPLQQFHQHSLNQFSRVCHCNADTYQEITPAIISKSESMQPQQQFFISSASTSNSSAPHYVPIETHMQNQNTPLKSKYYQRSNSPKTVQVFYSSDVGPQQQVKSTFIEPESTNAVQMTMLKSRDSILLSLIQELNVLNEKAARIIAKIMQL